MRTAQVAQVMPATSNRIVSAVGTGRSQPNTAQPCSSMVFLIEASSTRAGRRRQPSPWRRRNGNLHRLHPIERADRFLDAHLAVISSGSRGPEGEPRS